MIASTDSDCEDNRAREVYKALDTHVDRFVAIKVCCRRNSTTLGVCAASCRKPRRPRRASADVAVPSARRFTS